MVDPNQPGCEDSTQPIDQPLQLTALLASIGAARKQTSMYGLEHPNSVTALTRVDEYVRDFTSCYDRATCVFTHEAVIVNQHYYAASRDSMDMCERLRARGAMAITFIGVPPAEQTQELLAFLNAEPRDIRAQGGPSDYLRRRGVGRIVLTESIYISGDNESEDNEQKGSQWDGASEDMVIAAVIDWLSKQDTDEAADPPPKFPITRILSTPDSAAKLIREAVTKLHASRRDMSHGECVTEAINDLKSVAGDNPEEWDKAAPQIRKAISKLPSSLHPTSTGFLSGADISRSSSVPSNRTNTVEDAEFLVSEVLREVQDIQDGSRLPSPSVFDAFFGTQAPGLLSSWKQELQPTSVLESTGRTLDVLMTWETNAVEHGRIADALTSLLPRAVEVNDTRSALGFAEWLLNQALQDSDYGWRRSNIKGSLDRLDPSVLSSLTRLLLETGRSRGEEAIAALLTLIPTLSLELLDMLGTEVGKRLIPCLKQSLLELGQMAQPALARVLSEGTIAAKTEAVGILADISRSWAAEEIVRAIREDDLSFSLVALKALPRIRIPLVTEACLSMLAHSAPDIRCAALNALAEIGDKASVPSISKLATRSSLMGGPTDDQMAAISALGRIGGPEAIECLKSITRRRPLIGRARFEAVRRSALEQLHRLENPTELLAA